MFNFSNKIIFMVCALILFSASANCQVLELRSSKNLYKPQKVISEVYKPSKLILGNKNAFLIKAEPGSFVSLVLSPEPSGAPPFGGKILRVGRIINTVEDKVGEKGIIEISFELPPDAKTLVDKMIYFEVVTWKKSDFSDVSVAKIYGSDGKETDCNALFVANKPKKSLFPGFGPSMPGVGNLNRTIDEVKELQNSNTQDLQSSEDVYYLNKPLILRNLRAPELQEKNK